MQTTSLRTNSTEYFAATDNPDELASNMKEKIRVWREWTRGRGLDAIWDRKTKNYYGNSESGNSSQAVTRGGSEGELSLAKVNDFRKLIQEQLVTVTSQRPAGQARAINSDTTSLKSARIGSAIAEYYMTQAGFESKFVEVTERCLVNDEGFIDLFWDKNAGDPIAVDPTTNMPEMSGDVVMRVHSSWNVARDVGLVPELQRWYILTYTVNRFDAASAYPKFTDKILMVRQDNLPTLKLNEIPEGSDAIHAHLLVHDRTPAMPNGRYSLLIGDCIVLDSELPYKDFPVDRIAPSDVIDGPTGYSSSNDMMAMEQITDALHSILTTNITNFGGVNIVVPQGIGVNPSDIAKGSRFFEVPPDMVDKIRSLDLLRQSPDIMNYIGFLGSKKQETVGSVSGVLAAQASQGASGSAMALIQTQSISYNSGTQRSYFRLLSSTMTKLIGILRTYADTPRVAKIVGKIKATGLKEFKYTGQDLNSISSIVYEMVNPISQTAGGRLQLAQDLLQAGQITSPKQYITVATTGNLDSLIQGDEAFQMLILEENESLMEGNQVSVVITENHNDHILGHMEVLASPNTKADPRIVQTVLDHINDHLRQWQDASMNNPAILMATKQQPLPPPPQPQMPTGMAPGPQGGPPMPPPPEGQAPQLVGNGQAPAQDKAETVNMPNLPNLPGTQDKPTIPGVTDR